MYNKVTLMGRLCHVPELGTTPDGVPVLSFRIAVDRNYQVKGTERKVDFFDLVAWRRTAEFIVKYFDKGRMILIDGELQNKTFTDKNKIERTVTEILVEKVYFTGEAKMQNHMQASAAPADSAAAYRPVINNPHAQSVQGNFNGNGVGYNNGRIIL